jgi:predicted amidophosphoribosyltransferase
MVLLIDDVRTTGATLAAASDALLQAGAPAVATLALARAAP